MSFFARILRWFSEMLPSFKIQEGATIKSNSMVYHVENILNEDQNSAVVTQCRIQGAGEIVCLKCIPRKFLSKYKQEAKAFHYFNGLNADENNLVKVVEIFDFHDWVCFAFEKLEVRLLDFMIRRKCEPLGVREIRVIAQQMFLALNELKNAGITHANVKAENIMLVSHESQPFKVKLTGFGAAGRTSKLSEVDMPRTCGYSAPEVLLDCPLDQSVDMWSLGCTLAFLYLGFPLYPTNSDYDYMRVIVKVLGQPDQTLLDQGRCVNQFFSSGWRFKTPDEYVQETGRMIQGVHQGHDHLNSLEDLLDKAPEVEDPADYQDMKAFVDLLKKMLTVNPEDRISPADALNHKFIKMESPPNTSVSLMTECEFRNPDVRIDMKVDELCNKGTSLILEEGVAMGNMSSIYQVEEVLQSGSYGPPAKCRKVGTDEIVAVKVFRKEYKWVGEKEEKSLKALSKLDPHKNNIIRFIESFAYKDCFCLVFEFLDLSLFDFLKRQGWTPMRVAEIRPIAQQMLVALSALKSIGMTHADIKPDNIMLVDQNSQPFRVKLIDFGAALKTFTLSELDVIQAIPYRAPEVHLGFRPDEDVDVWSLGCTLVFLALGRHLFPIYSDYEALRVMVKLLGLPDKTLLDDSWRVRRFFTLDHSGSDLSWRLKTLDEYELDAGMAIVPSDPAFDDLVSLKDLLKMVPENATPNEIDDFRSFIDLLKKMLAVNPADRILPDVALQHRFITMEHLPGTSLSSHVTEAHGIQTGSQLTSPDGVPEEEIHYSDLDLTESSDKTEEFILTLTEGSIIIDEANVYQVEQVLGSGSYGEVAKCRNMGTGEIVAIKFFREDKHLEAVKEVNAYNSVSELDSDQNNFLRFIDCFVYMDCFCIVLELLDVSLFDFFKRRVWTPLRVAEIRPIAQQMLVTLSALKSIGMTHADIKSDNIMLVDQNSQPFKVKLIDFGLVCETSKLSQSGIFQAKGCRAPEVYLGLPRDEGIDMWSLGCTLAFCFLGRNLFPSYSEYEVVKMIVRLFGQPNKKTLKSGWHVRRFFKREKFGFIYKWRLKTQQEYEEATGVKIGTKDPFFDRLQSLDDLIKMASDKNNPTEIENIKAFVDLLKKMLAVNPADRILPDDALQHRFFTMEHLPDARNRPETTTHSLRKRCELF